LRTTSSHTSNRADGDTVRSDSRVDGIAASLSGAVAKTIAESRVRAIAGDVTGTAAEISGSDSEHVGDAHLTALWDAAGQSLGSHKGSVEDDSE